MKVVWFVLSMCFVVAMAQAACSEGEPLVQSDDDNDDTSGDTDADTDTDGDADTDSGTETNTGTGTGSDNGAFLHFQRYINFLDAHQAHAILITTGSSTDPGDGNWTVAADNATLEVGMEQNVWQPAPVVDLSNYRGSLVRIAFQYMEYVGCLWHIDDICIANSDEQPPTSCLWSENFDTVTTPALPLGWLELAGTMDVGGHWETTHTSLSSPNGVTITDKNYGVVHRYLVSAPIQL